MKIKISADAFDGEEFLTLTNEESANDNFVSLIVGDKEYSICVEDLYHAVNVFKQMAHDRLIKEKLMDQNIPLDPTPTYAYTYAIAGGSDCLHENCSGCKNGTCSGAHMISCPCKRCSPIS